MKIFIYIAVFIILFLLIGQIQITFKPFSVSLPYWYRSVGILLIGVGLLVYNIGELAKGYKEGFREGVKYVVEKVEKSINSKE